MLGMQTNKTKEQNELALSIKKWWKANKNNRHKWTANPVGIAIKEILMESNNFKYAPRGKAKSKIAAPNTQLEEIDSPDSIW
jgi:hypothetical protein